MSGLEKAVVAVLFVMLIATIGGMGYLNGL
jgi:hypothetical protein